MDYSKMSDDCLMAIDLSECNETEIKKIKAEKFIRIQNKFINTIETTFFPKTIKGFKEDLYLYNKDGYYNTFGESELKTLLKEFFKHTNNEKLFRDILYKVKCIEMIDRENFLETPNKINLKNGVLDVYKNTMEEHNPKYNFLYRLEIEYNPDKFVDCPTIKKFLMDISENDENIYWLLVEFIGYILISDYKIKKFLCIFGDGDNGKTTLANVITAFIDKRNVSGLSLNQLTEKDFLISGLYGMKLNIKGETMPQKLKSLEVMKSLTGDDDQHVDRKFRDSLKFKNSAKFIFHFNTLPEIDLKSLDQASLDRLLMVHLKHNFVGNEDNKNLLRDLTTPNELEGLLHLALEGLSRLRKNRKFTYDDETTYDIWKESQSNLLDEFMQKQCIFSPEYYIEQSIAYDTYTNSGYKPISKKMFTIYVQKYSTLSIGKRGKSKEQTYCYLGFKLKEDMINEITPTENIIILQTEEELNNAFNMEE